MNDVATRLLLADRGRSFGAALAAAVLAAAIVIALLPVVPAGVPILAAATVSLLGLHRR